MLLQVDAEKKELDTEQHLRVMADKETVSCSSNVFKDTDLAYSSLQLNKQTQYIGCAATERPQCFLYKSVPGPICLHSCAGRRAWCASWIHHSSSKCIEGSWGILQPIVLQARVKTDLERLEREKLELQDRITSLQTSIFKGSEKLDQFKLLMNWNQEELDQWAIAQKQKEEDNTALDKYRSAAVSCL